jgi:membrane associated rhomboid family serine protease
MVDAEMAVRAAMAVAVLLAVVVVWRLDEPRGRWGARLRSRLLLGVPWGTLVLAALVLAVYLFVQGGLGAWTTPVTLPFASWSYLYPQGMVLAPFAHSGPGHVTGNLLGTLAFAPIAEYAFSHFPRQRGSASFGSLRSNPYVRAFVLFPLGGVVVGLGTSLLHWGPVIGFSGVVFAFAGFALVRFPLAVVAASVARGLLDLGLESLEDPIVTVTAGSQFSQPPWVDVAAQGHLLGFLLGVAAGFLVVGRRRESGPTALRVLAGAVLFGFATSAWAVWWYQGADRYVLYRGLGIVVVVVMGVLAALAARRWRGEVIDGIPRRRAVATVLVIPLVTMAMVAVPVNLTTVADNADADASVTVRDYTVTYDERIVNPKASVLNLSVLNASSRAPTGGVIVISEQRSLWSREVSPGQLAFGGTSVVRVGGAGWEALVYARRQGWSARGGGTAYQVWLGTEGDGWTEVFNSSPATADATLDGKNVSVVPAAGEFRIAVSRGGETIERVGVPASGEHVRAAGLRFVRRGSEVIAVHNRTRVPVFSREQYD